MRAWRTVPSLHGWYILYPRLLFFHLTSLFIIFSIHWQASLACAIFPTTCLPSEVFFGLNSKGFIILQTQMENSISVEKLFLSVAATQAFFVWDPPAKLHSWRSLGAIRFCIRKYAAVFCEDVSGSALVIQSAAIAGFVTCPYPWYDPECKGGRKTTWGAYLLFFWSRWSLWSWEPWPLLRRSGHGGSFRCI